MLFEDIQFDNKRLHNQQNYHRSHVTRFLLVILAYTVKIEEESLNIPGTRERHKLDYYRLIDQRRSTIES